MNNNFLIIVIVPLLHSFYPYAFHFPILSFLFLPFLNHFLSFSHLPLLLFRFVTVPHSGSGVAPMSSLSGVELLGFWDSGMGGLIG